MRSAWDLYDELLRPIPKDERVLSCSVGPLWTFVNTTVGAGLAMSMAASEGAPGVTEPNSPGGTDDPYAVARTPTRAYHLNRFAGKIAGMPLRDAAELAKSWEVVEAGIGMAAVNAWHNRPGSLVAKGQGRHQDPDVRCAPGMFGEFETLMKGKRVSVIGHFPGIEAYQSLCELSVLERSLQDGDYPDPACEYLLPTQDIVIVTGSALVNKTMPRLLELSRNATTIVAGPSTTLSSVLFDQGVDILSGCIVSSTKDVERITSEGGIAPQLGPYIQHVTAYRSDNEN
jgi:uncharacterized protein (DUF4213/DUF364 family)